MIPDFVALKMKRTGEYYPYRIIYATEKEVEGKKLYEVFAASSMRPINAALRKGIKVYKLVRE